MAVIRAWIIAACWWVLRTLDALDESVMPTPDWRCVICGKALLRSIPKQHDGRLICPRHKVGVF